MKVTDFCNGVMELLDVPKVTASLLELTTAAPACQVALVGSAADRSLVAYHRVNTSAVATRLHEWSLRLCSSLLLPIPLTPSTPLPHYLCLSHYCTSIAYSPLDHLHLLDSIDPPIASLPSVARLFNHIQRLQPDDILTNKQHSRNHSVEHLGLSNCRTSSTDFSTSSDCLIDTNTNARGLHQSRVHRTLIEAFNCPFDPLIHRHGYNSSIYATQVSSWPLQQQDCWW